MDDHFVKVSGMKSLAVNSLLNDMYMEYYICIICMYTVIYVYVRIHYIYIDGLKLRMRAIFPNFPFS
jgi:hypothetical protein